MALDVTLHTVMAGLGPAIHVFDFYSESKTWMPAAGAGMTREKLARSLSAVADENSGFVS